MISHKKLIQKLIDKYGNKHGNLDGMRAKNCAKHGFMYTYDNKCILCIEEGESKWTKHTP